MRQALISELKEAGRTESIEGDAWKMLPRLEIASAPDAGLLIQDYHWANLYIPGYSE